MAEENTPIDGQNPSNPPRCAGEPLPALPSNLVQALVADKDALSAFGPRFRATLMTRAIRTLSPETMQLLPRQLSSQAKRSNNQALPVQWQQRIAINVIVRNRKTIASNY